MLEQENKHKETYIASAFAVTNSILCMKNIVIQGNSFLYSRNSTLNIIVAVFSLIIYAYTIFFKEKKHVKCVVNKNQFLLITVITLFWLITIVIRSDLLSYSVVTSELTEFIIYSFPALLFLPLLSDGDDLLDSFYKCRWMIFAAASITVVLILRTGSIQDAGTRVAVYSMAFGRALLLPTLLFFSKYFKEHRWINLACGLLCVLYILVFGSRFPVVCVAVFVVWSVMKTPMTIRKLVLIIIGIALFVGIILNFDSIIYFLASFLGQRGINSRSLYLLINGTFNYDSGRRIIYENLIKGINSSPIFGLGAGGGIVYLNNVLTHSFILDVFANLGYLFGSAFLLISIVSIIKLYRKPISWKTREFLTICICMFVPVCFFQTSMWTANYFWILFAFACGRANIIKPDMVNHVYANTTNC